MANYAGLPTRGPQALITSCVLTAITCGIIGLRMFTRLHLVKCFGLEDYLTVVSGFCAVFLTVFIGIEVSHGEGRHFDTVPEADREIILKAFYGRLAVYNAALALTKVSILWQYLLVFPGRKIRLASWIMMGVCIAYGIWALISNFFLCSPVPYFWDKTIKGRCLSEQANWFTSAGINIVTDLIILALPMPAVRQLQLPGRSKLALMGVFALGGIVALVSGIRLSYLYTVTVSPDLTWTLAAAATWSSVEVDVAIVCATLPALKPLLQYCSFSSLSFGTGKNSASSSGSRSTTSSGWKLRRSGSGGSSDIAMPLKSHAAHATEYEMQQHRGPYIDASEMEEGKIMVMTVVEQEEGGLASDRNSISLHNVHTVVGTGRL